MTRYEIAKNRLKKELKELLYYERVDKKIEKKQKNQIEAFSITFSHNFFSKDFSRDNESRIEAIAKLHGYEIVDEKLSSSQSTYWFKRII